MSIHFIIFIVIMTVRLPHQRDFTSHLINFLLSIKPIDNFLKNQAHQMMVKRAERIGVPWRQMVKQLSDHDWQKEKTQIENPDLSYPDYYLTSFHAYATGNLSWEAAWEVEPAAYAVHAKIWDDQPLLGDRRLREGYHQIIREEIEIKPQTILDLGCSVGMSSFALQELYPEAEITGLDLSPYFLAVAQYQGRAKNLKIKWHHGCGEDTNLPRQSFDLISACLIFHELPQAPAKKILQEAWNLLRSGGYLTIMDMDPHCRAFQNFPPYVFTLLKSTEPYLDQYLTFNIENALQEIGFQGIRIKSNSPRHRTIIAQKVS